MQSDNSAQELAVWPHKFVPVISARDLQRARGPCLPARRSRVFGQLGGSATRARRTSLCLHRDRSPAPSKSSPWT